MNGVVCPKPRRTGPVNLILTEGSCDMENSNFEMESSPPFIFGSPPSRALNPLIQDSQFGNDNFVPVLAIPGAAAHSPPLSFTSASARKNAGGCVPMKFGNKPAAVRIEGFNCRSSISSVA